MYVYAILVYIVGRGHWCLCILLYTNVAEKAMIQESLSSEPNVSKFQ